MSEFDGSTSHVDGTLLAALDGDWTIGALFNPDSFGEGSNGRIIRIDNGGTPAQELRCAGANGRVEMVQGYTTTAQLAASPNSALTAGHWYWMVATYSGTTLTLWWADLSAVTPAVFTASTISVASAGSRRTGATRLTVGNTRAGDFTFDGHIAVAFATPFALGVNDLGPLLQGDLSPCFVAGDPSFVWPLEGPSVWDLGPARVDASTVAILGTNPMPFSVGLPSQVRLLGKRTVAAPSNPTIEGLREGYWIAVA